MNLPYWARRWYSRRGYHRRHRGRRVVSCTLADLPVGSCRRVAGFYPALSAERRAQLRAYGLLPGSCVHVLQQQPVTVVQIGHTELALEADLASQVCVEDQDDAGG